MSSALAVLWVFALFGVTAGVCARSARADDDIVAPLMDAGFGDDPNGAPRGDRDVRARRLFEHGADAYEAGDYASAALAFERAFAMSPRALLLRDAGSAWARAEEPARAASALREYLVLVPQARDAEALRAQIVALDRDDVERREAARPAPSGGWLADRTFTWVALAASLVATGTGIAFWLDADSTYDSLANGCGVARTCSSAQVDMVASSLSAANVSFAIAGGAGVLSLALFFIEGALAPSRERDAEDDDHDGVSVSLSVGIGSLALRGAF